MTWFYMILACVFVALSTWASLHKRWIIATTSAALSTIMLFLAGGSSTEKETVAINRHTTDTAAVLTDVVESNSDAVVSTLISAIREERDTRVITEARRADKAIQEIQQADSSPSKESSIRISRIASNYFNTTQWADEFVQRKDQIKLDARIRTLKARQKDEEKTLLKQAACDDAKQTVNNILTVLRDMLDKMSLRFPGSITYDLGGLNEIKCNGDDTRGTVQFSTNSTWSIRIFNSQRPLENQDVELVLRFDISQSNEYELPPEGWIDISILRPNMKHIVNSTYEGISDYAKMTGDDSNAVENATALLRELIEMELASIQ